MARKAPKIVKWDTIVRGTNDYLPVTFLRQVFVDPETGKPVEDQTNGITVPFNLENRVVIMTVKKSQYDGVNPVDDLNGDVEHDAPFIKAWQNELKDLTAGNEGYSDIDRDIQRDKTGPWNKDYLFRIIIDCDDPSEGRYGPEDERYIWQNNYQGMYGMKPQDGKVVFRFSKKMTMMKPGDYYFDVRMMEKDPKQIGMLRECRDWAPIIGQLTIEGTPTNRFAMFDWEAGAKD